MLTLKLLEILSDDKTWIFRGGFLDSDTNRLVGKFSTKFSNDLTPYQIADKLAAEARLIKMWCDEMGQKDELQFSKLR